MSGDYGRHPGGVPGLSSGWGVAGSHGCPFPMHKGYFIWRPLPLVSLISLLEITMSIREKTMEEEDAL